MIKDVSQNGEATIVASYFKGKPGTLAEIGANDGITLSNSYNLIQAGWEAYLFEPSSVWTDVFMLHKDNPKVHVYGFGIAERTEEKMFFESGAHVPNGTDRALVSTSVCAEMMRWPAVDFQEKKVAMVNFGEWHEAAGRPTLDYISIDVEGMDYEVLKLIDLRAVGCKCLCIEWNGDQNLLRKFTEYCNLFGLKEIHRNGENLIFAI